MATIFMPSQRDGKDDWRPVEVTPLAGAEYRVEGPMPVGESWRFVPGSVILLRWKTFGNGERRLIPKGPVPTGRSILTRSLARNIGLLLGSAPMLMMMRWLPRQGDGRPAAAPFLVASILWALLAAIVLIWRKPRQPVVRWAAWSALCFGGLLGPAILVSTL